MGDAAGDRSHMALEFEDADDSPRSPLRAPTSRQQPRPTRVALWAAVGLVCASVAVCAGVAVAAALAWAPSGQTDAAAQRTLRGGSGGGAASSEGGGLRQVLFVLHDAGETFALNSTIGRLVHEGAARGLEVLVLPVGQPATDALLCAGRYAGSCHPLPATTLDELGIDVAIKDGTAGRDQLLSGGDLRKLRARFDPHVVVTGMNYAMQLQIGSTFKTSRGSRFAALFDSLRVLGSDSDISSDRQHKFSTLADEVWIASKRLVPSGWVGNFRVVGQPTLQDWRALAGRPDVLRAARHRLFGAVAATSGAPALCWFGGYGPGYEQALRAWCGVVRLLSKDPELPDIKFAFSIHPGSNYGDLDRRVIKEEGVEALVVIVPDDIPGKVAALSSNLTASQGSTGGVQSIFAGRPALYLDPAHAFNNADSLGVLVGLIPNVASVAAAAEAVRSSARGGWAVDTTRLAEAGVPDDAEQEIFEAVLALLKQ